MQLEGEEKGKVVAITFGVGALFFLDLVAYLLRLNLYKLGQQKKLRSYQLFANECFYAFLNPSFKFVLYSSFPKTAEVLGMDLCEACENAANLSNSNNFEYKLRVSESGQPRWDASYLQSTLPSGVSKIFIVGSQEAQRATTEMLLKLGYKPNVIATL